MSQTEKLYNLLKDGEWHSTPSILHEVYGGEHLGIARISARAYDLKKRGHLIECKRDEIKPTISWYRMIPEPIIEPAPLSTISQKTGKLKEQSSLFALSFNHE